MHLNHDIHILNQTVLFFYSSTLIIVLESLESLIVFMSHSYLKRNPFQLGAGMVNR